MSLDHAILGFLQYRPFTGYDLKKLFDTSLRHFWPADQSQIYRTLSRLGEQGWAQQRTVAQDRRPNRKEFHITEDGRRELARWLVSPMPQEEPRSAALVQIFFAGQLADERILATLEGVAAGLRGLLAAYARIPAQVEPYHAMVGSRREGFFWMLTVECGIAAARAQLEWLESAIRRIRAGEYTNLPEVQAPPGRAPEPAARPGSKPRRATERQDQE
jgi:DNA-binding PadR family transcriptional regulator